MIRGRSDLAQKKRIITSLCIVAILLGFLYVYYGSLFSSQSHGASALEYGSISLRKLGSSCLDEDEDNDKKHDESSTKSGQENEEDDATLKSFPVPIKWLQSRDEVWKANIPHTHLAHEKSGQNWMVKKGEKIEFPGGGTHFHCGADKYIASIANMLNFSKSNLNNEGRLRTVFYVGYGVASFGAYLLSSDIIAISLAPNDGHQNHIQFALERGIPAYLGVLGTKRLPYPRKSFKPAHCSRCRIDWLQQDGILLLELDRLLKPGGYFAYSSPEAYAQDEEDLKI